MIYLTSNLTSNEGNRDLLVGHAPARGLDPVLGVTSEVVDEL